jgi:hypothetical protein
MNPENRNPVPALGDSDVFEPGNRPVSQAGPLEPCEFEKLLQRAVEILNPRSQGLSAQQS